MTDSTNQPGWVEKLKARWNLKSGFQVFIVLIVFACTGFTILFIKKPIMEILFPEGDKPLWFTISYWILILPIYNVFLLFYGFIFGQFSFFWEFEKRFFSRMTGKSRK